MKIKISIGILLVGFMLLMVPKFVFAAAGDGSLQLDTSVLTNSGSNSVGTTGDFPIRGQLFSADLNQISTNVKTAEARFAGQTLSGVNFKNRVLAASYQSDMSPLVKRLFVNYKPTVLPNAISESNTGNSLLYGIIIVFGLILTIVAGFLGRWNAKRKRRVRGAGTD